MAHFHGMVVPPGKSPVFKANNFARIALGFREEIEDGWARVYQRGRRSVRDWDT